MELLNGILVEVSGLFRLIWGVKRKERTGTLFDTKRRLVFVWFATLIFPVYKILFMNRLEFLLILDQNRV
jgi:hypothetical protein